MRIEVIVPKGLLFDSKRLMMAVDNSLNQAAAGVQSDFVRTTVTWNHRPAFMVQRGAGTRTIYTTDLIYKYVSEGTKPHPIVARNAKTLHFFAVGFSPKTRPRRIRAAQGSPATSGEAFPVAVQHPGTQAREFAEVIAEQWQEELPKLLQDAIDAAVK